MPGAIPKRIGDYVDIIGAAPLVPSDPIELENLSDTRRLLISSSSAFCMTLPKPRNIRKIHNFHIIMGRY